MREWGADHNRDRQAADEALTEPGGGDSQASNQKKKNAVRLAPTAEWRHVPSAAGLFESEQSLRSRILFATSFNVLIFQGCKLKSK